MKAIRDVGLGYEVYTYQRKYKYTFFDKVFFGLIILAVGVIVAHPSIMAALPY